MPRRSAPWFKFFPLDWIDGTRDMTLEQRGAYIDCIAIIMAFDKPIPDDPKWMSHQMHISVRKWNALKKLLIEGQKLMETEAGCDNDRCIEERENRAKRSRRRLKKPLAKPELKPLETSRKPHENLTKTPQKEAEKPEKTSKINEHDEQSRTPDMFYARGIQSQREEYPIVPKDRDVNLEENISQGFENFWSAFPVYRKGSKIDARIAFEKLTKHKHRKSTVFKKEYNRHPTIDEIVDGARKYAQRIGDSEYAKGAVAWLNGLMWMDENSVVEGDAPDHWWRGKEKYIKEIKDDKWREGLSTLNGHWEYKFGPPPGHPECFIPDVMIKEFDLTKRFGVH